MLPLEANQLHIGLNLFHHVIQTIDEIFNMSYKSLIVHMQFCGVQKWSQVEDILELKAVYNREYSARMWSESYVGKTYNILNLCVEVRVWGNSSQIKFKSRFRGCGVAGPERSIIYEIWSFVVISWLWCEFGEIRIVGVMSLIKLMNCHAKMWGTVMYNPIGLW